jgi:hypothetical protein
MLSLVATARRLEPGMDGLRVRSLILEELAAYGVDANLVLVALAGQEQHLHPIASPLYRVTDGTWMKLVVGARCAEHIVSQTLMVKRGTIVSEEETRVYHALQQAAVEYADLYREEAVERDIHAAMIERFKQVECDGSLPGFGTSATLHHPGGGTSPLGNRDRMLDPDGTRRCEAWTQFAINPVDSLLGLKVELQGVIMPDGKPPLILNQAGESHVLPSRAVTAVGGTSAVLPELFVL